MRNENEIIYEEKIEWTSTEIAYLLKLVMSDLHRMDKCLDHAYAYGTELQIDSHMIASQIADKLWPTRDVEMPGESKH